MRQARRVFHNRAIVLTSIGYFGHMWELYAMWAWFLVFYRSSLETRGAPDGTAAAAATFAVIGIGALGCYAGGILGDRWGRARLNALSLAVSGACAAVAGLTFGGPPWLVLAVGLVWGFAVVADSAQYSTLVTEHADQRYVGTALTLQLAGGFLLTVVTIWLIPWMEGLTTWRGAFLLLVPGPVVGIAAMRKLMKD
jgi:MFS family permease